jgi:hypothetical protein
VVLSPSVIAGEPVPSSTSREDSLPVRSEARSITLPETDAVRPVVWALIAATTSAAVARADAREVRGPEGDRLRRASVDADAERLSVRERERAAVRPGDLRVCSLRPGQRRGEGLRERPRHLTGEVAAKGDAPGRLPGLDGLEREADRLAGDVENAVARPLVDQVAVAVDGEGPHPGVEGPIRSLDGEEAVALDGEVQLAARRPEGALRHVLVDGRDRRSGADLAGVRSARRFRGRGARVDRLAVEIRERDAASLEAVRVDVREVVADDLEVLPVRAQPAESGDQGRGHLTLLPERRRPGSGRATRGEGPRRFLRREPRRRP